MVCGRRLGVPARTVEIEGGDAAHVSCAHALVDSPSAGTTEELLDEWRWLASVLETGEALPTDDLTLALATRDVLEDRRPDLTPSEVGELDRIDGRYRAATRPDDGDVLATLWPHGGGWWWLRLPAQGEAHAYFEAEATELRRNSEGDIPEPA